jgi:hypothetical protein
MQKVYDDASLGIGKGDFEKPLKDLSIEFDCERYDRQQLVQIDEYSEEEEF